jgi:hypothetical protein
MPSPEVVATEVVAVAIRLPPIPGAAVVSPTAAAALRVLTPPRATPAPEAVPPRQVNVQGVAVAVRLPPTLVTVLAATASPTAAALAIAAL